MTNLIFIPSFPALFSSLGLITTSHTVLLHEGRPKALSFLLFPSCYGWLRSALPIWVPRNLSLESAGPQEVHPASHHCGSLRRTSVAESAAYSLPPARKFLRPTVPEAASGVPLVSSPDLQGKSLRKNCCPGIGTQVGPRACTWTRYNYSFDSLFIVGLMH
jgi:hypothetical protein